MTRTSNGERRLHDAMASHVQTGAVPGLIAAVERQGRLEIEILGVRSVEGREPVTLDTIFRIASITKPITAAAAMVLVEEGRLDLDEPVERLLPELASRRVLRRVDGPLDDSVPARRSITVRDLLTFRGGYGVVMAPPGATPIQRAMDALQLNQGPPDPDVPPAPDEWIRRLGTLPLLHQPGEGWSYQTCADILGVLIARAARQPFASFLAERVFAPLGMIDTGFHVPAGRLDRLAASYAVDEATGRLVAYRGAAGQQWKRPPAFPSGGGGLVSTVDDLLAFGRMMLSGGGRLLSPASVKLMTTDQLTAQNKAAALWLPGGFDAGGWGFGMAVITGKDALGRPPGTFGWDGGLGTSWWADRARGMQGVLLTQRALTSPAPPSVFVDFWRTATRV